MKKILIVFLIWILPILSFAQESSNPIVEFTEEDASPSTYPYKVKFPNSSVTDNLDGTASISFTGALDTTYLKLNQTTPQTTIGTFTFPTVNFGSATGVSATAASGKLTLSGIGNTNNKSLLLDFETTANTIYLSPNLAEILVRPNTGFDYAYFYNGSSFTDRTAEAKLTKGTAYTVVADNADFFYVGMATATFASVYFNFSTVAVGGTTLDVEYSQGGSSWGALSVTDGTSLFTQDGAVTFTAPVDWATDTVNSSSAYWVRFSTSTSTTTDPTAYITTRSNGSDFFSIYGNDGDSNLVLDIDKNGVGNIYLTGGDITINKTLTTTSTEGISAINAFPATASVPVRISPRLRFRGTAWNTSSLASETNQFIMELLPVSGNPTSCNLNISAAAAGAASYTNVFSLTSAGDLTLIGSIATATGKNFTIGTTQWNSGDSIDGTKVANADLGEISVSSGVWSVDSGSILLSELGGGAAGANAYDFGGATSLEIPNGANPTVDADGEIAYDSDDESLTVYDGSATRAINTVHSFQSTIINPDGVQAIEDAVPVFTVEAEEFPFGITLLSVGIKTDANGVYSVDFEEWTDPLTFSSAIETVATAAGTNEAEDDGTLTDNSIAAGSIIFIDLPTTDKNFLMIWGTYYINTGN